MKLGIVSTMEGAPWGGSEVLWSDAAERFVGRGAQVHASVKAWDEPVPRLSELESLGCRVERRRAAVGLPSRALRALLPRLPAFDPFRWLDRTRPDLALISQGWNQDGLEWMEACLARGIPYAAVAQAACESWWPDDRTARRLAAAYEAAAAAFFVSEGNLELTRTQLATPLREARIVRNPFNVRYEAAPPWPAEAHGWRLACVGRLDPKTKGQDLLLRVLESDRWRRRPISLTLFGAGPCEERLRRVAEGCSLENVRFAGVVDDVEQIWATHHALVLPSRCEGLPLVLVEAMLCGRPSIVTDVADAATVVEDGVCGFVAAAPTATLLDEALERAWAARENWQSIGERAARRIRELVPPDPVGRFVEQLSALVQP